METTNKIIVNGQQTSNNNETNNDLKGYVIGTISVDRDGIWSVSYIGHHDVMGKKYFGNGVVSMRNIRQLLDVVGSRLNNKKDVYMDKIKEVENATKTDLP